MVDFSMFEFLNRWQYNLDTIVAYKWGYMILWLFTSVHGA